jgi:hypothetical protein
MALRPGRPLDGQHRLCPDNCHSLQHRVVLQIMREGRNAVQGELHVIRGMAAELVTWFTHHAQTMDAALAKHLQDVNFDPASGVVYLRNRCRRPHPRLRWGLFHGR